jgi:hypothetical protein
MIIEFFTLNDFFKLNRDDLIEKELILEIKYFIDLEQYSSYSLPQTHSDVSKVQMHLRHLLRNNTNVKEIILDIHLLNNNIDMSYCCLQAIIDCMDSMKLESLSIRCSENYAGTELYFTESSILVYLQDVLHDNQTLKCFTLDNLHISQECTQAIGNILSDPCCSLAALSFRNSTIDHNALWINGLKHNSSLKLLDLQNAQYFHDQDMTLLASILTYHPTLTFLDLSIANDISERGNNAIAEALKTNRSLQYLNFTKTRNNEEEYIHFAQALEINTTLAVLILEFAGNFLSQSNAAFHKAFQRNTTLRYFSFYGASLNEESKNSLLTTLLENRSLYYLFFSDPQDDTRLSPELMPILYARKKQNMVWRLWDQEKKQELRIYKRSLFADYDSFNFVENSCISWDMSVITIAKAIGFFSDRLAESPILSPVNVMPEQVTTFALSSYGVSYIHWLPSTLVLGLCELLLLDAKKEGETRVVDRKRKRVLCETSDFLTLTNPPQQPQTHINANKAQYSNLSIESPNSITCEAEQSSPTDPGNIAALKLTPALREIGIFRNIRASEQPHIALEQCNQTLKQENQTLRMSVQPLEPKLEVPIPEQYTSQTTQSLSSASAVIMENRRTSK